LQNKHQTVCIIKLRDGNTHYFGLYNSDRKDFYQMRRTSDEIVFVRNDSKEKISFFKTNIEFVKIEEGTFNPNDHTWENPIL